jgi:type II secretory pathway pseudopilin PulG
MGWLWIMNMKTSNRGFTILELMFAFAILTAVTTMFLGGLSKIMIANNEAQARTHAMAYLGQVVSEMQRIAPDDLSEFTPTPSQYALGMSVALIGLDDEGNPIPDSSAQSPTQVKVVIMTQVPALAPIETSTLVYLRLSS